MAWALAVFSECDETLLDQKGILLINVEPQEAETSTGPTTDALKELQCLQNQVIVGLAVFLSP